MEIRIYTDSVGNKYYHKKSDSGFWHREDGPAIIYNDGRELWFYYDKGYFPEKMPLNLYLAYCKWEYKKNDKHTRVR